MLESVEWGEFRLGELFGKSTRGKRLKSADRISGILPFVTAGETDEGISAFIGNDVDIFTENTITIDMFGSAKYRNYKYGGDDHVAVIHTENLPKFAVMFITTAIHKSSHAGQFDYSRNFYAKDADELNISLPVKNGEINFDFMGKFIAELEAERIAELEAYLVATGLKNYTLTDKEQKVLEDFENERFEWDNYKIEDILQWQSQKEIDPLKLEKLKDESEMIYPFYGQATINNGIISYNQLINKVLNNENGKPTILIHSNNQNIVYLETPFYLKDGHGATSVLQSEKLNKINQMFIIASIDKVIKSKYSYNNKATKIELKSTIINLPIQNQKPDYKTMETLISAIQKLVIKEVVLYADRKIEATKSVADR